MYALTVPDYANNERLEKFASKLLKVQQEVDFKISARGWAYQLESFGLIDKSQFDRVEKLINKCRKRGILPVDFTAQEESRQFDIVETPNENTPVEEVEDMVDFFMSTDTFGYTPDWWDGEEYYIQMVVEKIDLKTLFHKMCRRYHIPIATSKGWSSIRQRATFARRFMEAEQRGLKPVLLYCGDHDPDGLRISDFLRKNLYDISGITWSDGTPGYDPSNLVIERFGLDADFINEHDLTWIQNLITGSGKNLASPKHPNHDMDYVQEYLRRFGEKKCEANAIVPKPDLAKKLATGIITQYLGDDALARFQQKHQAVVDEIRDFKKRTGLNEALQKAKDAIVAEREGE